MPQSQNAEASKLSTQRSESTPSATRRKESDRLKEDLIAMVYHDIRSPLSNIVSSLEVLSSLSLCTQDATARSMVEIAQRSSERIQRLIDTLLDIDRMETGQTIGSRKPVSMRALIREATETVQPVVEIKQLAISTRFEAHLPPAFADEDMILRVLINLLENAAKFTPARGKIRVTAQLKDDMVLTSIKDDGPGIAPGDQDRIFEKYTQLTVLEDGRSLGLGLAYCRLAVNGHGGRIWVESDRGQGAVFRFTLPAAGNA